MNAENRYVIQRFSLKAGFLAVFALAQQNEGYLLTLSILFALAALINTGLALYHRTPLRRSTLNYWDEAAAFTLMSGVAGLIARN